ncbi:MAG: hypothetical protein U0T11_01375 [Chitinophagaceae bacterium]
MSDSLIYSIPARFRKIENLHILFWLIKDACWALNWHIPALIMIVPTLGAAVLIAWQTRKIFSELMHNLAVLFWIVANCTWMIGEFYAKDEGELARHIAVIPFAIGLIILAVYYFRYFTQLRFREQMEKQAEQVLEEEKTHATDQKTSN